MVANTLSAAGPGVDISFSTSYQAPVIAFANFWPEPSSRLRTSLRTTSRSRISPGIWDELNNTLTSLALRICETSGFQVTTTGLLGLVRNADAISESEVLT